MSTIYTKHQRGAVLSVTNWPQSPPRQFSWLVLGLENQLLDVLKVNWIKYELLLYLYLRSSKPNI